jgi:hypothetical protein
VKKAAKSKLMKKLLILVLAPVCTFSYLSVFAQGNDPSTQKSADQTAGAASAKEARWDGKVVGTDKIKSTLAVRRITMPYLEKTIHYDEWTKWVSQQHGSRTVNNIDPGQVKAGDRVICLGWEDEAGFHAGLISKRLTNR